jgi:ketosteroid isomerase-like protein
MKRLILSLSLLIVTFGFFVLLPDSYAFELKNGKAALVTAIPLSAQEWSDVEKEVWKMEEKYWILVKNLDLEGYLELWHPEFVGWPISQAEPAKREDVRSVVEGLFTQTEKGSFVIELTPYSSKRYGDVVVVFYRCKASYKDLEGNEHSILNRFTHTWMKHNGNWTIIAGMNADE